MKRILSWVLLGTCLLYMVGPLWAQKAPKPLPKVIKTDVCFYGGISASVIGSYAVQMKGKKALIIEPGEYLGGMSSGGLGSTDIGNKFAITGLARDFYRRLGQHYGTFEQWNFEPSAADKVFRQYLDEAKPSILMQHRLVAVRKVGTRITEIELEHSANPKLPHVKVQAQVFIDCSYEGDLMAKAGVSYTVGREDAKQYGEDLNGVQLKEAHQFPDGVDPYVIPGKPESGLLFGVSQEVLAPNGTGDKKVQAYNFRLCITDSVPNQIPFTRPAGYDSLKYTLLVRQLEKMQWKKVENLLIINKMPNRKTDVNNKGGFSTDFIGMNWDYPEASYKRRAQIWKEHENYIKGLLWFLSTDPRLPEDTRSSMKRWGWAKDEFVKLGGFSHQLYVREARRMVGELVMTQAHCQHKETVSDAVGMAAYQMDSHNCQRLVVNGMVKNEGDVQVGVPGPYPIAYRAIIPKEKECSNLLVPVCLSATHIAYGSIRMEPVFMVLAQSAAYAALQAIDKQVPVQKIDVKALQAQLENDPLAKGETPEVLCDDLLQSAQVSYTGKWEERKDVYWRYGQTYRLADTAATQPATVTFRPQIKKAGTYQIYIFNCGIPKTWNGFKHSDAVPLTLVAGNQKVEKTLAQRSERWEWTSLGTYTLKPGEPLSITLTAQPGHGFVTADAVLCVPVKK